MDLNYSTVWTFVHFWVAQCGFVWPVSVGTIAAAHQCRTNADCDTSLGQSCYWLYDGCQMGQCMCDPKRHRQEPSGYCTMLKYGHEPCSGITDVCQEGMACSIDGSCQCTAGTMTRDGQYCLRPGQRLLGEKCWPASSGSSQGPCLHKSSTGYTKYDVHCSVRGECECREGYKADGITCRRWNMKEFGCTSTFHCQGGAICSEGQCVCPRGYVAVAGNSKCAKRGAVTELRSGAICDEINELRYCGRQLVCHKCPEEEVYKCVNFLMVSEYAYLGARSSASYSKWRLLLLPLLVPFYIHR